jgi:5'-nucleotidase
MSKGKIRGGIIAVAVFAVLFSLIGSNLVAQDGSVDITILYTQEHHGQAEASATFGNPNLGGLPARSTVVNAVRDEVGADNVILVDTGDILIGTTLSSIFRGEPDVLAYNAIGYDAAALGNHEFDFEAAGDGTLASLQALANYPMMGANVSGSSSIDPGHIILTRGGVRVLIIGIANPVTLEISSPAPGTTFGDPAETVQSILDAEAGNYDISVALTHEDTFLDVGLLQAVADLDVIIGGHTFGFNGIVNRNTFEAGVFVPDALPDQEDNLVNPDGVYVRAGGGPLSGRLGSSVGRLTLTVAGGDVVTAISSNIVIFPDTADNVEDGIENLTAEDPAIQDILDPFIEEVGIRLGEVVGSTAVLLDGERANVRSMETNLGNFIADAWRETQGTDIGFQNSGGIRASISPGDITLESIQNVHPFGNSIAIIDVTGQQLLDALENGVGQVENGAGRFPQISGMAFTYDAALDPGSRVVSVTVGGAPLDLDRVYSLASNNFVLTGGDGYSALEAGSNYRDTQFLDAFVLADFIRNFDGPINIGTEGRITRLN